jgi:hypothetical protein
MPFLSSSSPFGPYATRRWGVPRFEPANRFVSAGLAALERRRRSTHSNHRVSGSTDKGLGTQWKTRFRFTAWSKSSQMSGGSD